MASILVIDDDDTLREGVAMICERDGHTVEQAPSGDEGVKKLDRGHFDVVVTDLKMSGLDGIGVLKEVKQKSPSTEVIIMTAHGTVDSAISAVLSLGAYNYLQKPFGANDNVKIQVRLALERQKLRGQNERLTEALKAGSTTMIGESAAMDRIRKMIDKIAASNTNVHIAGESGTGKEVVAQLIHEKSSRSDDPLIKVNCGAIPETLIESELFGHEKGAFTGAIKRKLGRFELADGGSIFLDEIAELPPAMQVKLLRVLQEKEIDRVGGERPVKVDVRVISATNRNLKREVEEGRFREDLFYRLHVVPIELPPLRERTDDILPLARFFLRKLRGRTNSEVTGLSRDAESHLLSYHYPGNVRELENIIEQAMVFATPPDIQPEDLPLQVSGARPSETTFQIPGGNIGLNDFLEAAERQMILRAYERANGVKTECAKLLDIKTSALYYKLEKYGIGTVAGRNLEAGGGEGESSGHT
jgi:two-component system response regulator HydG